MVQIFMMTNPIADMLTRIRNALLMKRPEVAFPYSRIKESLANILQRQGYIAGFEMVGEKVKKAIVVQLKYLPDGAPAISHLRQISKPSHRVFCGFEALKPFRSGMGMRILTTSRGMLSDAEARNKKMGGEILLEVW